MSTKRVRVILLGFLALLAATSFDTSTAYGAAGPFWHHRAKGGEGAGEKIEEKAPEEFTGEGSSPIFIGEIASTKIEITAKSVQAKGIIYNNAEQGQGKLLQKYHGLRLEKPVLNGCEVRLGTNNELKITGHLAWKWDGTEKQLKNQMSQKKLGQAPSGVALADEISAGTTELPNGTITTITLIGSGCGVLAGTFEIRGSITAEAKPHNLEEWSTHATVIFGLGDREIHFWNGKEFIGTSLGLTFGGNPASYKGLAEGFAAKQEVAVFEK
jgi:hypothetical protein